MTRYGPLRIAPFRASFAVALAATLAAAPALAAGEKGAGTEDRDWIQGEPTAAEAAARRSVNIQDDVRIKMRDGVELDARLFTPAKTESAPACVLMMDGYGLEGSVGARFDLQNFDMASRGYSVLHVSLRASGESGGEGDLYPHFGEDGYDLVEWMAEQPWCNGHVGMMGASLLGISQWLTAKEAPPHLETIAPHVACGDCYAQLWYPNGMNPGPGREARKAIPGAEAEYANTMQHRNRDAWWSARSTLAADHAAMAERGLAVFISGGFDDYITPANLKAYQQFGGDEADKRLMVGPWGHGLAPDVVQNRVAEFFDHELRGAANGWADRPRATIFVKGPDMWRNEEGWPIPDAREVALDLSSKASGSIESVNDGTLAAGGDEAAGEATLSYDPENGPFLPALLDSGGRTDTDQTPASEKVLTWTSAPLDAATEVTGYPRLRFSAASSAPDADLVAEIVDVAPDGSSTQVVQGYMNLPRAKDMSAPTPLTPGEARDYELEFYPIAYVFQPGHRIRLVLAGAAKAQESQKRPQGPGPATSAFELTLKTGGDQPAALVLPVIGEGDAQLAAAD